MDEIKNGNDLKKLVYPALSSKKEELYRIGYKRINEDNIWEVLYDNIWSKQSRVALCDIVDDILNYNNDKLYSLFKKDDYNELIELPKLKEE